MASSLPTDLSFVPEVNLPLHSQPQPSSHDNLMILDEITHRSFIGDMNLNQLEPPENLDLPLLKHRVVVIDLLALRTVQAPFYEIKLVLHLSLIFLFATTLLCLFNLVAYLLSSNLLLVSDEV